MEVKCPYCFDWSFITDHDYNLHNYHICTECTNLFKFDDAIVQLF